MNDDETLVAITPSGLALAELMNALIEWKDAGAHVWDVCTAIEKYIDARVDKRLADNGACSDGR
jgi:hypothetical protein